MAVLGHHSSSLSCYVAPCLIVSCWLLSPRLTDLWVVLSVAVAVSYVDGPTVYVGTRPRLRTMYSKQYPAVRSTSSVYYV